MPKLDTGVGLKILAGASAGPELRQVLDGCLYNLGLFAIPVNPWKMGELSTAIYAAA